MCTSKLIFYNNYYRLDIMNNPYKIIKNKSSENYLRNKKHETFQLLRPDHI